MILRMEPITAIIVAVILGWGWTQLMHEGPICQVQEVHEGKTVLVPKLCSDVITSIE